MGVLGEMPSWVWGPSYGISIPIRRRKTRVPASLSLCRVKKVTTYKPGRGPSQTRLLLAPWPRTSPHQNCEQYMSVVEATGIVKTVPVLQLSSQRPTGEGAKARHFFPKGSEAGRLRSGASRFDVCRTCFPAYRRVLTWPTCSWRLFLSLEGCWALREALGSLPQQCLTASQWSCLLRLSHWELGLQHGSGGRACRESDPCFYNTVCLGTDNSLMKSQSCW